MKMPFLEMLLFKKCLIGVLRFFLTKITAFILRKVIALLTIYLNIVQSNKNHVKNGSSKNLHRMG